MTDHSPLCVFPDTTTVEEAKKWYTLVIRAGQLVAARKALIWSIHNDGLTPDAKVSAQCLRRQFYKDLKEVQAQFGHRLNVLRPSHATMDFLEDALRQREQARELREGALE